MCIRDRYQRRVRGIPNGRMVSPALSASVWLMIVVAPLSAGADFPPFVWNSTVPTDRGTPCPFEQSTVFSQVRFNGQYATYGGADTWYPSWGSDGNLYTPWTDGAVGSVAAGSACATPGCMSSTGFAIVSGDDPMHLNISTVGKTRSSPSPYHGRYPSASLYYNHTWFYGTYALDELHGFCGDWCTMGPFVGFRWSTDQAATWTEPRVNMTSYADNLFGEAAPNNRSKVKFGAPHVVDFGRELEHSPDGKMYIIGHGASQPWSPASWMQGSEVYMARVNPTVQDVSDKAQWEFYAGRGQGDDHWVRGDVSQARPLVSWGNSTGVTTMTYLSAVKKYLMCISTPMVVAVAKQQYDTYLLESSSLVGPFSIVSYMAKLGPEAYFVNVPSKFVALQAASDGSLDLYLSYSANYDQRSVQPMPPGSGYHWTLQHVSLLL
eukprot:TRINITY_DN19870_c0_g2_i1.p1 TRINITY_DN19870_c0_g2~~TRINITY_DN19870_c0_g2_i1.p1  ORF type:complete len:435 (+),score=53.47 TRINITY_DN19870_c0_g2_i1:124-1428(+)